MGACGDTSSDTSYNLLDYFPLDVGDKWVYNTTYYTPITDYSYSLISSRYISNIVNIDGKLAYNFTNDYFYKDNSGIYTYEDKCDEKWIKIIPASMSIGDTYIFTAHCVDGNFTVKLTLENEESVSTPAGNFVTLKFKREFINATNGKLLEMQYFNLAKNIGDVKESWYYYNSTTGNLIYEKNETLLAANITGNIYGSEVYLIQY